MADYSKLDFKKSLLKIGIKKNDNIFCHSNIGFFGKPKNVNSKNQLCNLFLKVILDTIGKKGNLIVPTFSYSFFEKKNFERKYTPSKMGIFSEWVRKNKLSTRSNDPNFSVSCIGPDKEFFCSNGNNDTYSEDNFFAKFHNINGKILDLNFPGTTIIHYYERKLNVKYRFNKKFFGKVSNKKTSWFVLSKKLRDKNTWHNPFPITNLIKKKKIAKFTKLGKGEIL